MYARFLIVGRASVSVLLSSKNISNTRSKVYFKDIYGWKVEDNPISARDAQPKGLHSLFTQKELHKYLKFKLLFSGPFEETLKDSRLVEDQIDFFTRADLAGRARLKAGKGCTDSMEKGVRTTQGIGLLDQEFGPAEESPEVTADALQMAVEDTICRKHITDSDCDFSGTLGRYKKKIQSHPFHLVSTSPWPLAVSISLFITTFGTVRYMHNYMHGGFTLALGLCSTLFMIFAWCRDIIRENSLDGAHTMKVQEGLCKGAMLFIVSEFVFFYGLLWSFMASILAPVYVGGGVWPPVGFHGVDPNGLPLFNTLVLLASSLTVSWAQFCTSTGRRKTGLFALLLTSLLASLFLWVQYWEFLSAPFSISHGIYGSVYHMISGCHCFHVVIGLFFLAVSAVRLYVGEFTKRHQFGFVAAVWYWHFIDLVWLAVYALIYWWGFGPVFFS
uniref:Cytochrome c oxidase subunit 3 n=1 Tax=Phaeophyceae sp. TaxID=2249243 RepID=A0A8E8U513_9PHAE|nr:Cox3 [Phaeophyceae sp.]